MPARPTKPTRYRCTMCSYVYDPAQSEPHSEAPVGTSFEALPEDWLCPDCGASKADFEPMKD